MRILVGVALALASCGGGESKKSLVSESPDSQHVHGLAVNPADGALFVATHEGLFRSARGSKSMTRVGPPQDTMGFTVVGPDHFVASGHPGASSDDPPLLGLIESRNAGRSWQSVVLAGKADFHAIDAVRGRIYAGDARTNRLFEGQVGASGLSELRSPPGTLIALSAAPSEPDRLVGATDRGIFVSRDGGRRWRGLDRRATGLITYDGRKLVLVTGQGTVAVGRDARPPRWHTVGSIGGLPAALTADAGKLYVSVQDGPVKVSADGGRSWSLRVRP